MMLGGRRWGNGLTWRTWLMIFVVRKETTKTAAIAAHNLKLCPLVLDVLEHIPAAARVGPLIVDETAGRPYAEHAYAREWRAVARKAGIPDTVWNMHARAGGISEADDAGADLDMIRSAAGHTQASTTARMSAGRSANHALLRSCARRTGRRETGREQTIGNGLGNAGNASSTVERTIDCDHSQIWSGRSGSNRRHTAWEAVVLPLNYARGRRLHPFPVLSGPPLRQAVPAVDLDIRTTCRGPYRVAGCRAPRRG
jgi:hypothetical protein